MDFMTTKNSLSHSQHGFLKGKSTETALIKFYDFVTESVDKNLIVDSIFFISGKHLKLFHIASFSLASPLLALANLSLAGLMTFSLIGLNEYL